jgi:hypothetical protein
VRQLSLFVQAGPDAGRRLSVTDAPVTIGRGQDQTLRLSDGAVSRHHLTLLPVLGPRGDILALDVSETPGVNPVWTIQAGDRIVVSSGFRLEADSSLTLGNTTVGLEATQGAGPRQTLELDVAAEMSAPRRLSALAALGEQLAKCGSLQAVFRTATQWAVTALPCSRALVLSPDGHDVLGAAAEREAGDLALSRTMLHRVLAERRALLIQDVLAEPDLAKRRSVQVRGIRGAMAAPAKNLIFYGEWDAARALNDVYDEDALLLLVCAAQLVSALGESATERSQLKATHRERRAYPAPASRMIGSSSAMQRLQIFMERVAASPATVLLLGESGTGKELAAGMIHNLSAAAQGPFVAINCAAIAEQLLESELFGHEKGAFTGAVAEHDGVFSRADTGTLFLDEIGEMSLSTQARMLRVLETRRFTRVGGSRELSVDVRLVAATHRDLRRMVAEGPCCHPFATASTTSPIWSITSRPSSARPWVGAWLRWAPR